MMKQHLLKTILNSGSKNKFSDIFNLYKTEVFNFLQEGYAFAMIQEYLQQEIRKLPEFEDYKFDSTQFTTRLSYFKRTQFKTAKKQAVEEKKSSSDFLPLENTFVDTSKEKSLTKKEKFDGINTDIPYEPKKGNFFDED